MEDNVETVPEAPEAIPEPEVIPEAQPEVPGAPVSPEAVIEAVKNNPGMSAEELAKYFPDFSVEAIHELRLVHLGLKETVHI